MYLFSIAVRSPVGLGTGELSGIRHTLPWVERVEEMSRECALYLY